MAESSRAFGRKFMTLEEAMIFLAFCIEVGLGLESLKKSTKKSERCSKNRALAGFFLSII